MEEAGQNGGSESGVDVTLIRWMLSLTPSERLAYLEDTVRFIEEARERITHRERARGLE